MKSVYFETLRPTFRETYSKETNEINVVKMIYKLCLVGNVNFCLKFISIFK